MRGRVSSNYEQRLFQANNCNLLYYDSSKLSTYALMLDANNLYGVFRQNDILPLKDFALDNQIKNNEILTMPSMALIGYIVEVDTDYPHGIHKVPQNFPLALSKLLNIKHS